MVDKKYSYIFLYIAVISGLLLVFLVPPMCSPDENYHFYISYNLSNLQFPRIVDGNIGYDTDREIYDFIQQYNQNNVGLEVKYSFNESYISSYSSINEAFHKEFIVDNYSYQTNIMPHLFSAISICIWRFIFKYTGYIHLLTPYNYLLFARIGNLAFYLVVAYFSIRKVSHFKKSMLILLLMPMSLFLAASSNCDAILIPTSFYFFSVYLDCITKDNKQVNNKDLLQAAICVFIFASVKLIMVPYIILLLTIPMAKFRNRVYYAKCIITITAVMLVGLIITTLGPRVNNPNSPQNQQLSWLIGNFTQMPAIFINTLKQSYKFWVESFFGKLGNLDLNFPIPMPFIFYVSLFVVILSESFTSVNVKLSSRILSALLFLCVLIFLVFYFYIGWTSQIAGIGVNYSTGIQGRYFIPIVVFLLPIFMKRPIRETVSIHMLVNLSTHMAIILSIMNPLITVLYVILKYYTL